MIIKQSYELFSDLHKTNIAQLHEPVTIHINSNGVVNGSQICISDKPVPQVLHAQLIMTNDNGGVMQLVVMEAILDAEGHIQTRGDDVEVKLWWAEQPTIKLQD